MQTMQWLPRSGKFVNKANEQFGLNHFVKFPGEIVMDIAEKIQKHVSYRAYVFK